MATGLFRRVVAGLSTVLAVSATLCAAAGCSSASSKPVTVLTQNLYLGGDIDRPIRAAEGRSGHTAVLALGHADLELRRIVDCTSFGVRGRLLAREIADARPDAVGLQEVALWRSGPLRLAPGPPVASRVDLDFLPTLLTDLSARGARYDVAAVQQESDVEAPAFAGDPFSGTATDAEDVRLTDRDVVLVRHGSGLTVAGSGGGQYRHRLNLRLADASFAFVRGYAWADLTDGRTRFRFLTTHLEASTEGAAAAQAEELLAGPAGVEDEPAVVVGDLNSDAADPAVRAARSGPHASAYGVLTGSGQLADEWLAQPSPGAGFTSGLSELVNDSTAAGLRRRIDLVFARGTSGEPVGAVRGAVLGAALSDRDPTTGLWPSDHAGVLLTLRIG